MATVRAPSPPRSPASVSSLAPRPPKLPLPPLPLSLPGERLSIDSLRSSSAAASGSQEGSLVRVPFAPMSESSGSAASSSSTHTRERSRTTYRRSREDDEEEEEDDFSNDSSTSTSPSSLTPTLPVTPKQDAKILAFPTRSSASHARPSTAPACVFPTTGRRNEPVGRKTFDIERRQEQPDDDHEGSEDEEDCGCGSPPAGFSDSEDDLDVLDFVLQDQQLALRGTSSASPKIAGETGLGLFKRPGVEGLSLSPSVGTDGEPTTSGEPSTSVRRPSTAPATISTDLPPAVPTPRTRTRTVSKLLPKLRLPRPGSSESDDSAEEEARDSDETISANDDGAQPRRRLKKRRSKTKKRFDRFIMPSEAELLEARQCELVGETGVTVTLEDLIKQRGRVVFVALRHFWCNLCQQYVQALREAMLSLVTFQTSVDNLSTATQSSVSVGEYHEPRAVIPPLYIVLVSTGSYRLIPSYRQRLDCPFPLYVDRSRKLYKTLGMTKSSLSMGKDSEKGSYIRNSQWENVVNSTKNGLAMPRYPGPQAQLGGEFVFTYHEDDDSVSCEYASRMHTTRAHAEIRDLFAAAGVQLNEQDADSVYGESAYSQAS